VIVGGQNVAALTERQLFMLEKGQKQSGVAGVIKFPEQKQAKGGFL
jgi:hypothetical protein